LINGRSRGGGSAALAMTLQPLVKIILRETNVVLHPTRVRALKVQKVYNALSHKDIITYGAAKGNSGD
jgi:hypothetical protein